MYSSASSQCDQFNGVLTPGMPSAMFTRVQAVAGPDTRCSGSVSGAASPVMAAEHRAHRRSMTQMRVRFSWSPRYPTGALAAFELDVETGAVPRRDVQR